MNTHPMPPPMDGLANLSTNSARRLISEASPLVGLPIETNDGVRPNFDEALTLAKAGARLMPLRRMIFDGETDRFICNCRKGKDCTATGKHPMLVGWADEASSDPEQIRIWWWWSRPGKEIGIGQVMGGHFFGLDIDGPVGEASLARLVAKYGPLPETLESSTGRTDKGRHLRFRKPLDRKVTSRAYDKGLDVKGEGGYLVAPPTLHKSGARYQWTKLVPIALAPNWLLDELDNPIKPGRVAKPDGEYKRNDKAPGVFGERPSHVPKADSKAFAAMKVREKPRPYSPEELTRVTSALAAIPTPGIGEGGRTLWANVGMALKSPIYEAGWPEDICRKLWDDWSKRGLKPDDFKEDIQEQQWQSFKSAEELGRAPIGIGTLFKLAREYGWHDPLTHGSVSFVRSTLEHCLNSQDQAPWPEPELIPQSLAPVAPFDLAFLPESIGPWVYDAADRMQCPPDLVAIPAVVALGSTIGNRVAVRPMLKDDWTEVANLWGLVIGRPASMKTPSISSALAPLEYLDRQARKKYEADLAQHALTVEIYKAEKDKAKNKKDDGKGELIKPGHPPIEKRYIANDTTYEALGVILADNPTGVLVHRDELVGLLKTLDQDLFAATRGFYLEAWNGYRPYRFDRVIRGRTHVDHACLSLIGGTQPGRIAGYMRQASTGGATDDGLIQRFSLLVWPDQSGEYRRLDRYADTEKRVKAWDAFSRLDALDPDKAGAERDVDAKFNALPFLRFDNAAAEIFNDWRDGLEGLTRGGTLPPALEAHFTKYRKLVPALSLINHLCDGGAGPISERAVSRAVAFSGYLETHARRAYGSGAEPGAQPAGFILPHIQKGDLRNGFTARDVQRKQWSGLTDLDGIKDALALLCELGWLRANMPPPGPTGGRPSTIYTINPRGVLGA